jgi:DNA-binding response OmpR family regulator
MIKKEKPMNSQSSLDRLQTLQVLYVEDDAVIRESIGASLGYYFDKVLTAASYEEALNIYHDETIDILFSDIEMPGKSGIELVKEIRSKDRKIPVVMVTAYSTQDYLMKLINQNIQHYLVKPVTLQKLEEALYATLPYLDINELVLTLREDVSYFPKRGILHFDDQDVQLSSRERVLMNLLLKHKNHFITYSEIEYEVWYPDIMSQSALKSMIYNLRKKLPRDCIKTYAKEGYLLQCD